MKATLQSAARPLRQGGYVLLSVLIVFLSIQLIGVGTLTVVTSDLHGAIASQLAIQALSTAEAGLNHALSQGVYGTFGPYTIELGTHQGVFQGSVVCTDPLGATSDLTCREKDMTSTGSIGRARRKIVAHLVRRTVNEGTFSGFCGRDGVGLDQDTVISADVGSNGDILVQGPSRARSMIRARDVIAPSPTAAFTAAATPASPPPAGLAGDYTWRVTYVYKFLGSNASPPPLIESMGGPPTAILTLSDAYGTLTNFPESASADVVSRRIYRTKASDPTVWYFVAEIPRDNASLPDLDPDPAVELRGYLDSKPDDQLFIQAPRAVAGNAFAGGRVDCSDPGGCPDGSTTSLQVSGLVRWRLREGLCPAFTPPPCTPGSTTPSPLPTSLAAGTYRWAALTLGAGRTWDLELPVSDATSTAEVHIHASSLTLERDTRFVVRCSTPGSPFCAKTRLYFHVAGNFVVGQRSWFGVNGASPSNALLWPGDQIQIISCAQDGRFTSDPTPSVLWNQDSRVSALIFAPDANIQINQAGEFIGSLYGRHIQIDRATGFVLDPGRGFDPAVIDDRLWFLTAWYDDPRP